MIDSLIRAAYLSALMTVPAVIAAQGASIDTSAHHAGTGDTTIHFQNNVGTPASLDVTHSPQPQYPRELAEARVVGAVHAQFVVDTAGHAEMATFKVIGVSVDVSHLPPVTGVVLDTAANTRQITEASKQLFTQAVQTALPKMHFFPATVASHPVRELVAEQFNFTAR